MITYTLRGRKLSREVNFHKKTIFTILKPGSHCAITGQIFIKCVIAVGVHSAIVVIDIA